MNCAKCNEVKSLADFYKGDRTCKTCRCAMVRANRASKAEKYRAYDRDRALLPKRVDQNRRVTAEWRASNLVERAAQVAVGNAVRDGRLFKWPACAVPDCESTRPVAHHPDYSRPLDVIWLCQAHHKQAHALVKTPAE